MKWENGFFLVLSLFLILMHSSSPSVPIPEYPTEINRYPIHKCRQNKLSYSLSRPFFEFTTAVDLLYQSHVEIISQKVICFSWNLNDSISNSMGNPRTTSFSVVRLLSVTIVKQNCFFVLVMTSIIYPLHLYMTVRLLILWRPLTVDTLWECSPSGTCSKETILPKSMAIPLQRTSRQVVP